MSSPHAPVPIILRSEKRYGHSTMIACFAERPKEWRYAGSALATLLISVLAAAGAAVGVRWRIYSF